MKLIKVLIALTVFCGFAVNAAKPIDVQVWGQSDSAKACRAQLVKTKLMTNDLDFLTSALGFITNPTPGHNVELYPMLPILCTLIQTSSTFTYTVENLNYEFTFFTKDKAKETTHILFENVPGVDGDPYYVVNYMDNTNISDPNAQRTLRDILISGVYRKMEGK